MIVDLGLAAAALLALWAFIAGCRKSGGLRSAILAAVVALIVNVTLAWHANDDPESVLQGSAAAFGILVSISLFAAAVVAGAMGRLARRLTAA